MSPRRPPLRLSLERRVRGRMQPRDAEFRRWAAAALGRGQHGREFAIRLVSRAESRALNARYRGRDRPTNVLSFPALASAAAVAGWLGDLVLCPALVRAEARVQHKSARAHWAHLVVHGTLHLLGFDHEQAAQARRMERRERRILAALGYPDPYRARPEPAGPRG